MELESAEAPDRPNLHGEGSENQGEADLASPDNPETALASKYNTLPPDQWKVREIIGEEVIGGRKYYLVDWVPTLEPGHNLSEDLLRKWRNRKAKMQGPGMKRSSGPKTKKITDQDKGKKRRGESRRG
jgi:hypothetical protein